ncbi:choice-of-anchor L domain-containing protein [Flavobacterium cerinum]|uniref:Choice-of-anchor L domain-containing protein n=1 Tax=Flavobacterium cerinum TaxID=2502784 RepID=A0ABY5IUB4_9FLAO|nr:choice-of-anchor L domain-containing protein [Flavobacterium cerinum]UUC45348.1 choice-of-anchor L domain-containing protein [Flavobacterium cerinum]
MQVQISRLFTAVLLLFSTTIFAQYIQVTENYTDDQLVRDKLFNSSCAQVSNISINGYTFSDGAKSYGYFQGASGFPFNDGIIITTGKARSAVGPNTSILSEGPSSWVGDQDLEQAIGESNTINATVLEFDFVPISNKMSFDYVFASEQYLTNPSPNQCNYSDGFAFLLKESGATQYQNLAVVPGTNTPVKVTTVRGPGTICPQANAQYFGGFNDQESATNYNGQTKTLRAEATVTPGVTYHIKLVIADQGNQYYDSAIFLKGGSFNIETDLGPDRLIATGNPLCPGTNYPLDATVTGTNVTYQWFDANGAITGATNPIYDVTAAGTYRVETTITSPGGTCTSSSQIVIEYAGVTANNATLIQCAAPSGPTKFNLTQANNTITGGSNNLSVAFYPTLANAQAQSNLITNPDDYTYANLNTVTARVENQFGCVAYATVTLQIVNNTITPVGPQSECDNDGDSKADFDLNAITAQFTGLPAGAQVQYFATANDALLVINPLNSPYNSFSTTIYARVINGSDCYGIAPVALVVNNFNGANIQDETKIICPNTTVTLNAPAGFTYEWNNDPTITTQSITVNQTGTYTVKITNADGCFVTKTFTVVASAPAVITSVTVNDFASGQNSATVNYQGIGDYEFSLDGVIFQDSPTFTNLDSGEYTVTVKDKKECGIVHKTFFVLDYPRFFTPNGDGYNDVWRIPYLNRYPTAQVAIFDRYGKLLHFFKGGGYWNGQYNRRDLPSTDYWFTITFDNGRVVKGHFSMLR